METSTISEAESLSLQQNIQQVSGALLRLTNEWRELRRDEDRQRRMPAIERLMAALDEAWKDAMTEGQEKLLPEHRGDALLYYQKGLAGYRSLFPAAKA